MNCVFSVILLSCVLCACATQYWDQPCTMGDCPVQNVHIATTGDTTQMVVSWLTMGKTATSTVLAGTSSNKYNINASGDSHSYLHSDYNDVVFWNHDVVITNLQPATKYYYVCGDEGGGYSGEFTFVTPPVLGSLPTTTTVLVYGDMGISNSQKTIRRLLDISASVDKVFHVGDISYADDYNSGMYEAVWNQWFMEMQPLAARVPYMVAPGNHEYSCEHQGCGYSKNFTAYNQRFRMPHDESGGKENMWYSYDYGLVHYVVVSTETDFDGAPEPSKFGDQLAWLKHDLEKAVANRKKVPWIIVGGHRPIYSSSKDYSHNGIPIRDPAKLQAAMEGLFKKYGIDIFFCGHVHSYERLYPTYQNKRVSTSYNNPQAPVYVVNGAAGNTEGLSNRKNSTWEPTPSWSAWRFGEDYGYGVMKIDNDLSQNTATLLWQFFRSTDGGLEDQFVLTKDL